MKLPFLQDTNGKPSASLTLSVIAFAITSLWFLLSFLNIKIAGWSVKPFEEGPAIAFLIPCLSLYWGRRFSDSRAQGKNGDSDNNG